MHNWKRCPVCKCINCFNMWISPLEPSLIMGSFIEELCPQCLKVSEAWQGEGCS